MTLRKVFGSQRDEVMRRRRELNEEELCSFVLPVIVAVIR
jgi:hypothetical protein